MKILLALLLGATAYAQTWGITPLPGDPYKIGGGGSGGSIVPAYTQTVTAQTSVSISAATHGQGALAIAFCFDNSTPRNFVGCAPSRDTSGNLVFTFLPTFTGLIEVTIGGGGASLCGQLTNAAPSCSVDTTNANNITSGTLLPSLLPAPTVSTLGGVEAIAVVNHKWINGIDTSGVPSLLQPNFGDLLSGTNSVATLTVGTGASLTTQGSGTINANRINGQTLSGTNGNLVSFGLLNSLVDSTISSSQVAQLNAAASWTSFQNFAAAPHTLPAKTGVLASIPATCTVGEQYFANDATAGANLYGCVTTNSWAVQAGGGGGGGASAPLGVTFSSSTVLNIGAACSGATPCLVRVGSSVNSFTSVSTATVNSGSGTVYFYVDGSSGNIIAGIASVGNPSVTCSGCTTTTGISTFPPYSIPLAIWTATSGTWPASGTDQRSILSGPPVISQSTGISVTPTAGAVSIALSGPVAKANGGTGVSNPTSSDPGCTVSGDIGKMWIDNTSAVTTHFKVCGNVTSTTQWITVF